MTTHRLQTYPGFWDAIATGRKTFEVRKNDRDYKVGDLLELVKMTPGTAPNSNPRYILKSITYVLPGGQFGIAPDYCVMALGDASDADWAVLSMRRESGGEPLVDSDALVA